MPICNNPKYVGKNVTIEFHIGCGDTLPLSSDWKRLGAMRTKEVGTEWDNTDATADDSVGSLRESLATYQSLTISGDGVHKIYGAGAADLKALNKHVLNPLETGGQPVVWLRITFPDITIIAYMLLTSFSRSAPHDDVVTYSLEATATASDLGIIVEDTPDVDAADVTSVTVSPATATMEVGDTEQLSAVVAPATAHQVVYFTSSNPAVATVNPQGLVRAIAEGSATITARAATDSSKTGTCAVTVS